MRRTGKSFEKQPFRQGPFSLSKYSSEWAAYPLGVANYLMNMDRLPDFSEDSAVFMFSDYGGDHKGAKFNTYSFLLIAADKRGPFEEQVRLLREKYSLGKKEIAYKDLAYGPIKRSIKDFLLLADNCIHGVIFTIAIDKSLDSVFGERKKGAWEVLQAAAETVGAGEWHPSKLERMYRIYCPLVLMMDLVTDNEHKVLWQSDTDKINEEGAKGNFSQAQVHFSRFLGEFTSKQFPLLGFAKTFEEGGAFTDFLSYTDLAAGMVQDLLCQQYYGIHLEVEPAKGEVCKWLASQSKFLQKLTLAVVKKGDDVCFDPITFTLVE